MPLFTITTEFRMKDGRLLECERDFQVTRGNYSGLPEDCYPDESEEFERRFLIDGEEIELEKMPKGLEAIAERLETAGYGEFGYKQSQLDYDDFAHYFEE